MSNKKTTKVAPVKNVLNRRASYDYQLGDELKVGIVLTGPEVRAARDAHVQLKGSFVTIRDNQLWLNNASFSIKLQKKGEPAARTIDTEPRKLLATRKQIEDLQAKKQAGMSIIPTKLITNGKYIKLIIALGVGKKRYDKRETIKRRDQDRDTKRLLKYR